jgi:hypothetical protein
MESHEAFDQLLSEEVTLEASLASDVRSLWGRLARTPAVCKVRLCLASAPDRIRKFCAWVERLVSTKYDPSYRHPEEAAICAALVILEQSPLAEARNLMARLKKAREPSLVWIQRMAEHCDAQFVEQTTVGQHVPEAPGLPALRLPSFVWVWCDTCEFGAHGTQAMTCGRLRVA